MSTPAALAVMLASALRNVLRSIGLPILDWKSWKGLEEQKPVIHSRKSAVCCCLVHIIPLFVSGVLLYFNLKRYFIGSELEGQQNKDALKLSVLQVCAKAQVPLSAPQYIQMQILLDLRRGLNKKIGTGNSSQHYNNSLGANSLRAHVWQWFASRAFGQCLFVLSSQVSGNPPKTPQRHNATTLQRYNAMKRCSVRESKTYGNGCL